jgi:hypothetical protein
MTISVSLATVADSISKLSISGVNVKDINEIPEDASKVTPVLYPKPNGFVSAIKFSRATMGGGGTAKMDLEYTLTYRYLHAPVGGSLGLFSTYQGLITNLCAIVVSIMGNDNITGVVDMQLESVSDIGPLSDPAGSTMYHGVDISLRVLEFTQ